jgi:PAS domain S-box-containing protein
MHDPGHDKPHLFETFIRSTQYIVRLKTHQDLWDHLGKLIVAHFPADWIAFVERDSENGISIHHCTLPEPVAAQSILSEEVRTVMSDVLDSGFLASHILLAPRPSMTAFLPIVEQGQPKMVMLIGHKSGDMLSKELLDIYLAIAGLAGSTFERLKNEVELNRHRAHLEELVKGRTAELTKATRQNELILHSVGEGICGLDVDGNITFINPSAARIIGWDPEESIGRNAHATFHHTRPDGCSYPVEECPVHSALRNGNAEHITNEEFVRQDGTRFPVEFMTTPIMEEGQVVGAVIVFRDITERKQAEEALRKAHEALQEHAGRLEAVNKELESFSYSVSHDLRSPLRAIAGFTRMILDEKGATFDPETLRKFGIVQENALKMGRLIDDLLRLSRLGRAGLNRAKLDMTGLVRETLQEARMAEPGREFATEISDLPMAQGDPAMVRQLLANLLFNAVKFTRGRQGACIEVGSFERSGEQVYYVKDNGVGFDMKYYSKIFGVFQRLVSEREFEGTGVGLAIVQRVVQRHGGRVWAEGKMEEGATFYFTLPPKEQE